MPHYPVERAPRCYIDEQMPDAVRDVLVPILEKHHDLIPKWCEFVEFFWAESPPDYLLPGESIAASTLAFYDYLNARIDIYPNFLTRGDLREMLVVHELLHLQLEPFANTVKDLRDFLIEHHPEMKKHFNEIIRHAEERTTSSLAHWIVWSERIVIDSMP